MKKQIKKNKIQRKQFKKYELKRLILKSIVNNINFTTNVRWSAQTQFQYFPVLSSKTRIKNICVLTGRTKSIYKKFKLSRIQLKKWASLGFLPGISQSSW